MVEEVILAAALPGRCGEVRAQRTFARKRPKEQFDWTQYKGDVSASDAVSGSLSTRPFHTLLPLSQRLHMDNIQYTKCFYPCSYLCTELESVGASAPLSALSGRWCGIHAICFYH